MTYNIHDLVNLERTTLTVFQRMHPMNPLATGPLAKRSIVQPGLCTSRSHFIDDLEVVFVFTTQQILAGCVWEVPVTTFYSNRTALMHCQSKAGSA